MLPDFFVIGAQKAGSTYLLRCLGEHPQIFMPPAEVAFFEETLYSRERLPWFEAHFDGAESGQVVGVKRPNLLGLPECPPRLHEHMPGLKLVAVLREPTERAVSGYFHYMKTGFLPVEPIESGMRRILDGEYGAGPLAKRYPRAEEVLAFGRYHEHLCNYLECFPREQMHVVLFDDLKSDARETLDSVYRFLGVEEGFDPPSVASRPMAAPYSIPRLRLWNALDRMNRVWASDNRYFRRGTDPLRRGLHLVNAALDSRVWSKLFASKRPQLSESLQAALAEHYREDTRRLAELLGRPLAGWAGSASEACEKPAPTATPPATT